MFPKSVSNCLRGDKLNQGSSTFFPWRPPAKVSMLHWRTSTDRGTGVLNEVTSLPPMISFFFFFFLFISSNPTTPQLWDPNPSHCVRTMISHEWIQNHTAGTCGGTLQAVSSRVYWSFYFWGCFCFWELQALPILFSFKFVSHPWGEICVWACV